MEFRKANVHDVDELVVLRKRQLLDEGGIEGQSIDGELREYFSKNIANGSFIAWLAVENNAIIATSGLCFYELPPNFSNPSGKVAYITNMYTKNEFRRKGIASKLLEKTINEARLFNRKLFRLHASSDGRNMYLKYGFVDSEGYMHLRINPQ